MYVCAQLIVDAPDVNIKLVPASEASFTKIFFPSFFFFFLKYVFQWEGWREIVRTWEGGMDGAEDLPQARWCSWRQCDFVWSPHLIYGGVIG